MLRKLIELCVQRRLAAIAFTLGIAAFGIHAYLRTPIEAFPDVTNLQVTVIAQVPGLAAEEVERQLTVPLERALNGTPGMMQLRSESLFGLALVNLVFDDGADPFKSRAYVNERVASASVPAEADVFLAPNATPLGEIYQYRLASDRHDLYQLRAEQEFNCARVLRQVPGVADVVSFGGYLKEFHVEVDPDKLLATGVTLAEVVEALEKSNRNAGGGIVRRGDQEYVIRSVGYLGGPRDIESVVLRAEQGTPVTVGDVARILQSNTPRRGTVGLDRTSEVVEGFVVLRRGENPSDVLEGIHQKVAALNSGGLPAGMRIEPFYDRSDLVSLTLHTVHENLLHGAAFIIGVVWIFLRSMRGSLVIASVIPLALLVAFSGLYLLGLPANLISMGAIDFGILVDGAVILVERVFHQMRHERPQTRRALLALIARSAAEVAKPILFSMSIIIAALIPVFTLERVEGRIFRPLAMTYSFALLGALVFSLTVVPALCAIALRPKDADHQDPRSLVWLRALYGRILAFSLKLRWAVLAGAVALLVLGAVVGSRLGSEFLPQLDEGDVVVFVEMPASIALEKGAEILLDVRTRILAFPEVKGTMSEHGRPEDGTDNEGSNMSETFVRFHPRELFRPGWDKARVIAAMRTSLTGIPGVRFNVSQPIKDNVEEAVSGVRGQVVLKVFGPDLDKMRATLLKAKEVLAPIAGVIDLDLYRDAMAPQVQIRLDRQALAREGIALGDAQAHLEAALAGRVVTELWEGERPVPIRVRLPAVDKSSVDRLRSLLLPTPSGARIPLARVADVSMAEGRAAINREANSRFAALKFNVQGRDVGSVIQEAMALIKAKVPAPDGHNLVWSGEFENQQRAMQRLQVIVPVALLAVLALLYMALGSARGAVVILLIAPTAMTGGIFGLKVMDINLSVSAAIGFIALLGQVALAGLLVIGAIEDRRRAGDDLPTAIVSGATTRFLAVLMASLLAMLGLMPMVASDAVGSETQKPFAVAIVGGMVTALFVALLVLPVIYTYVAPKTIRQPGEEEEA